MVQMDFKSFHTSTLALPAQRELPRLVTLTSAPGFPLERIEAFLSRESGLERYS